MDRYVENDEITENTDNGFQLNEIEKKLILYVAKTNQSMSAASSEELHDLILTSIRFGQSHPNEQAEFLYIHNGRKGLTRKVIQTAGIIKNAHIEKLKAYGYIAIAIDAEKMGSKHILDVIISNVFSKEAPLNFKTFYNFTGTAEAYKDAIKETVNELNEIGFTVSGIVADNLKVQ